MSGEVIILKQYTFTCIHGNLCPHALNNLNWTFSFKCGSYAQFWSEVLLTDWQVYTTSQCHIRTTLDFWVGQY